MEQVRATVYLALALAVVKSETGMKNSNSLCKYLLLACYKHDRYLGQYFYKNKVWNNGINLCQCESKNLTWRHSECFTFSLFIEADKSDVME